MAQQTFSNGDALSVVQGVINNNATNAESRLKDNQVIVKQASDFGTISSTKEYFIDGIIDMGTTQLVVPSGGITIKGYNFDQSQLVSSENSYTMIVSDGGTGSGNILFTDVAFEVSGTSSALFGCVAATGFEAVEMNRVNFNDCTSLGFIDGYRQGLESGTGRFGGTPELEFRNTWIGGYRITTSIARSMGNFTALFKAGTGFTFSGRVKISINCDLPTTGALLDISPSNVANDESLELSDCRITRNGSIDATDTDIYPNINDTSVKSIWGDNVGITNTNKYIRSSITTEVTTTVASADVYYPLLGTFTVQTSSHIDMPDNGEFRLLSGNGVYQIAGDLILESSPNDTIDLRVTKSYDNGLTWPDQVFHIRRQVNSLVGGRDVAFFPINFLSSIVKDERLRIEVENVGDNNNITAELDSYFIITGV
jgi:hypothetical protein